MGYSPIAQSEDESLGPELYHRNKTDVSHEPGDQSLSQMIGHNKEVTKFQIYNMANTNSHLCLAAKWLMIFFVYNLIVALSFVLIPQTSVELITVVFYGNMTIQSISTKTKTDHVTTSNTAIVSVEIVCAVFLLVLFTISIIISVKTCLILHRSKRVCGVHMFLDYRKSLIALVTVVSMSIFIICVSQLLELECYKPTVIECEPIVKFAGSMICFFYLVFVTSLVAMSYYISKHMNHVLNLPECNDACLFKTTHDPTIKTYINSPYNGTAKEDDTMSHFTSASAWSGF
ncbi:protein ORF29 [Lake sturgeon herpesvirus]|nr:protein ORF29 [Lake sturgeon herpesvirus]